MEVGGSRLSPRIGADKMRARVHLEIMASQKLEKGPAVEMEIASQVAQVILLLFMVLTCVDITKPAALWVHHLFFSSSIISYSRPSSWTLTLRCVTGLQIATALAVGRGRVSVRICEYNAGDDSSK